MDRFGPPARLLISAFIVFHVACIAAWSLPSQSKLTEAWKISIRPYMLWTGLWQGWDMFSPNPLAINASVEAEITLRDGTRRVWAFPSMEALGYGERYVKERYRKLRENVRQDLFAPAWPDVARWIARQAAAPRNPAVAVALTRQWTPIPAPFPGRRQPRLWPLPLVHRYTFFRYEVDPGFRDGWGNPAVHPGVRQ